MKNESALSGVESGAGLNGASTPETVRRRDPFTIFLACIGLISFYAFLLLIRTDGLNGDEAGYWNYARTNPIGDTVQTMKPPLFYYTNFWLMRGVGALLPSLESLGVHLFYLLGCVFSVVFWSSGTSRKLWPEWAALLVIGTSTLYAYHATHLMMETAVFVLLPVLAWQFESLRQKWSVSTLLLCMCTAALAIALKETSACAIFFLVFYYITPFKRAFFLLTAVVGFGLLARYLSVAFIEGESYPYAVKLSQMDNAYLLWKLKNVPFFLGGILFFALPACVFSVVQKQRLRFSITFVLAVGAALALLFVSRMDFLRYVFPICLALNLIAVKEANWKHGLTMPLVFLLSAGQLVFLWDGYRSSTDRFELWPVLIREEYYEAGSTVLVGYPIFWDLLRTPVESSKEELCVYSPVEGGEMNFYIRRSLPGPFGGTPTRYVDTMEQLAKECENKAVFIRTYGQVEAQAQALCGDSEVFVQPISHFSLDGKFSRSNPGYVKNISCTSSN